MNKSKKFIMIWVWVSIIFTLSFGAMFYLAPAKVFPPATTVDQMARFVGVKNLIYGLLMLYAVLKKQKQLLVVLLFGRGITDIGDGFTGISMGYMIPPYFMALGTGIITVIAGFFLSKTKESVEEN